MFFQKGIISVQELWETSKKHPGEVERLERKVSQPKQSWKLNRGAYTVNHWFLDVGHGGMGINVKYMKGD